MDAVVSYFATFASDFAAALAAKASDPIAWVACMGGLSLRQRGNLVGHEPHHRAPGRSWAWGLAYAALFVVVRMLADAYSSPVSRGDNAAFAFILLAGFLAGTLLARSLRRRSV